MHGEGRPTRWAAFALVALLVLTGTIVGSLAYNAGVSHGLAIGASAVDIEAAPRVAAHPYAYHGYGWHPFGFLGPVLFLFFWFFVLRMLFWRRGGAWGCGGGGHWRRGYGPGRFRGPRGWDRWDRHDRYDRDDDDDDRPRGRRDML